jgi:hypothetical protein
MALIPAGDQLNSRGQRPRKSGPPGAVDPDRVNDPGFGFRDSPRSQAMRPFQGQGAADYSSGGVAPGYCLSPLQGTRNTKPAPWRQKNGHPQNSEAVAAQNWSTLSGQRVDTLPCQPLE